MASRLVRTNAVTVNDVLDGRKLLEIDCVDRVYLTLSVPNLVVGGQVVSFLTVHEQRPIPSPALLERRGQAFRRAVTSFAEANGSAPSSLRSSPVACAYCAWRGPADVRGRAMAEEFFLNGVPVEPSDGAEPPHDGGPGVAAGFEVARESTRCPRGGPGISAAGAAGTSLRTGAGQARTLPGRGQRTGSWRSSGTSRVWLRPGGWASRGPSKWKPTVRRPRRSRQVTLQAHPPA